MSLYPMDLGRDFALPLGPDFLSCGLANGCAFRREPGKSRLLSFLKRREETSNSCSLAGGGALSRLSRNMLLLQ